MLNRAALVLASVQLTVGQWPASGPELCVVPTTVPVRPDTTCADIGVASASCESRGIDIAAQRGESEGVQLLLRKEADLDDKEGGLSNVTLELSVDKLPLSSASTYQVGYVFARRSPRYEGSGGGWRPDPLLPLKSGDTIDVPPGVTQPLWISFVVRADAEPGLFNGSVTIRCAKKCGDKGIEVPLTLSVWNLTLPSLNASELGTAWSGTWDDAAFEPYYGKGYWNENSGFQQSWYDVMINHRTPPDAIYRNTPRSVENVTYMAERGVRWVALLDVSSLPLTPGGDAQTPHAVSHAPHGVGSRGACSNYTDEYVTRLIATLKPTVTALRDAGLLDRTYVYGFDENPPSCEPMVRKLFGATKKEFPDLTTAAVLNWNPMPTDLPVDIWVLQYEDFDAETSAEWLAAGKQQWHYHCIEPHSLNTPNTFLERPTVQARAMFWNAAARELSYGAPTGWLYYAVNLWRPCQSDACGGATNPAVLRRINGSGPFTDFPPANFIWQGQYDDIFVNGDGQFVYPCPSGACSTVRLEGIRDGLEDWELIRQAKRAGVSTRAVELVERVIDENDGFAWRYDGNLLEQTRRDIAEAIMSATR